MALLGNPCYKQARNLTLSELSSMNSDDLIMNYIVLHAKFKFPESTKYPSIPCYLDESTTIYPLEGESVISGIEYLLAKKQKCTFLKIQDIFMIPFERVYVDDNETKKKRKELVNHPFKDIIMYLQSERRKYPKNTLGNLAEKEMGNSIYGNVVRGMSNKKKFDIKTGRTIRMEGGLLTSPIIAS